MEETMIVLFFRKEGFYPIEVPKSDDLARHAALNPGTLKITDMLGEKILWKLEG